MDVEEAGEINMPQMMVFEEMIESGEITEDEIKEYVGTIDWYYDFNIDYGDGTNENINLAYLTSHSGLKHTYASSGEYIITIKGTCQTFVAMEDAGFEGIINEIISWGNIGAKLFAMEGTYISFPSTTLDTFKNAYYLCFNASYDLTTIPDNFLQNCNNLKNVESIFSNSQITSIPSDLFSECPNIINFMGAFGDCTNLTGIAPELWLQYPNADGYGCFYHCTGLSNYSQIPSGWKDGH